MIHERVTIFGGSGFVGKQITERLAVAGSTVRVAVRHPDKVRHDGPPEIRGRIEAVRADVTDDASVRAAVEGANAVINLVGILYETGRASFTAIHEQSARRVATAARDCAAVRMVQMSALGASPDSPSAYARSKAAGERAVREVFPGATVVRPSIVIGPEDDFFNQFASMAGYSPALPLIGGGRTRFQPVYVGDVAAAVGVILDREDTAGKTYELGGPRTYSFKQLMELLLDQIGKRRLLLPLPFFVAEIQGMVLQNLPKPPLTRDQVELLKTDNVLGGHEPGLRELGVEPTPIEEILPTYLNRYR